jgi:hypothetical protein
LRVGKEEEGFGKTFLPAPNSVMLSEVIITEKMQEKMSLKFFFGFCNERHHNHFMVIKVSRCVLFCLSSCINMNVFDVI